MARRSKLPSHTRTGDQGFVPGITTLQGDPYITFIQGYPLLSLSQLTQVRAWGEAKPNPVDRPPHAMRNLVHM